MLHFSSELPCLLPDYFKYGETLPKTLFFPTFYLIFCHTHTHTPATNYLFPLSTLPANVRWGIEGWRRRKGGCCGRMEIESGMQTSDMRKIWLLRKITLSDWHRVCQPAGKSRRRRCWATVVLVAVGFHILATKCNILKSSDFMLMNYYKNGSRSGPRTV